jgi:hypothetical protein
MEFLKNRRKVLNESWGSVKKPDKFRLPPALSRLKAGAELSALVERAQEEYERLKSEMHQISSNPAEFDEIYRAISDLLGGSGKLHVGHNEPEFDDVSSYAEDKFLRGQPPRKSNDTAFGDAINWEWVLRCAEQHKSSHKILIVSKDSDYGEKIGINYCLNEWLAEEFATRVGSRHQIKLTANLTDALKILNEPVSEADEVAEQETNPPRYPALEIFDRAFGRFGVGLPPSADVPYAKWTCLQCGSAGPWSGSRCLSCGSWDDGDY